MNEEEIQQFLDQASSLYNDASYEEAIGLWEKILEADPGNNRAQEGIKMVGLLTTEWEAARPTPPAPPVAPAAPEMTTEALAKVQQGVVRVQQLLEAGQLEAAREGVDVLLQVAGDHAGVIGCEARLEAAQDPQAFVQERLALARHYLMQDQRGEAWRICTGVLAVSPGDETAKDLLAQAGGAVAAPAQAAPAAAPHTAPAAADSEPLELIDLEDSIPVAPPEPSPAERIQGLLAEGDQKRDAGQLQQAMDIWSRVFIVDDNNQDAEKRIDDARRILEEQARKVEELVQEAEDLIVQGYGDEACAKLEHILVIMPNHHEARTRLEELRNPAAAGAPAAESAMDEPVEPAGVAGESPLEPLPVESVPVLREEPPAPRERPRPAAPVAEARPGSGRRVLGAIMGVALMGALGYAGYLGWQTFFPGGGTTPRPRLAPPPSSPAGGESGAPGRTNPGPEPAQAGVGSPAPSPAPASVVPDLSPEESVARAKELVKEAGRLARQGQHAEALARYREAQVLDATNFEAHEGAGRAETEVQRAEKYDRDIASIRSALGDRDYQSALYKLYRVDAPGADARAMVDGWIHTSWYNWGVTLLKAGNVDEAREKFEEVLEVSPQDREAQQHLDLTRRYAGRGTDASFDAYSGSISYRSLN
jgi:tetratricopeptide (TPR) repeat protein